MRFNSIRFKISVFYTAILGLILIFYTALTYYNLRYTLYRDLDNDILVKAQEVSSAINSYLAVLGNDQRAFDFAVRRVIRLEGSHSNQDRISEVERAWLAKRDKQNLAQAYINFASVDRSEEVLSSSNLDDFMLKGFLSDIAVAGRRAVSYKDVNAGSYQLRVGSIPFYHNYRKRQVYLIQIGVSRKTVFTILYGRLIFAAVTIPLILLLASFFGGVITDRVLKPIMDITKVASNVTYKDLSIRVKSQRGEEELKYLVNAFNEMISRLDRSFRYIAEFSSNVAHELKTPLTIIRGESDLALMQERDTGEYQRVLKVTLEEAEGMLKIVDDLLLLSRLEYEPSVFNFELFDFVVFINEIFAQARRLAEPKKISVKLACPDKPVVIKADMVHLRRMFLNLLNNAVKFTPAGGTIAITVRHEGRQVHTAVSDTGIGIRPEHLNKIFDRFFHIDAPEKAAPGGTGLGLSIALSIARMHQGDISVESHFRQGAIFTVTLPVPD
ncbi:MAG TPA: ATP-binding protein [Candidatus Omnitrophota bacterium]|nr:ATP-binding protein [Candidatus Omnitrophota bacterium]